MRVLRIVDRCYYGRRIRNFSETNNVPCYTVLYLPYVLPIAFHTHTDILYLKKIEILDGE